MPSFLILEDGSGIPDANSFVTVAEVVSYCAARALVFPSAQAAREAAIIEAGEYLQNEVRWSWRGTKQYYEQSMPFPRTSVTEYRGLPVPINSVPWRVKQAQMYLAYLASQDPGNLDKVLERGGKIKTKTVGPITTTFMDDAPVEFVIQKVQGLLYPLLSQGGWRMMAGTVFEQAPAPSPDVFAEDAFNNPGSGT
jgi:hypothetical protein